MSGVLSSTSFYSSAMLVLTCFLLVMGIFHTGVAVSSGKSVLLHKIRKRQATEEPTPIPLTQNGDLPLPQLNSQSLPSGHGQQQGQRPPETSVDGGVGFDSNEPSQETLPDAGAYQTYRAYMPSFVSGTSVDDGGSRTPSGGQVYTASNPYPVQPQPQRPVYANPQPDYSRSQPDATAFQPDNSRPQSGHSQTRPYPYNRQPNYGVYGFYTDQQPTNPRYRPPPDVLTNVFRGQRPVYFPSQPTYTNGQPTHVGQTNPHQPVRPYRPYVNRQPIYGENSQAAYVPYNPRQPSNGCPETGIRLRLNGMYCPQALRHFGSALCYQHELSSRECCEACRSVKIPTRTGCEYGDHSYQCRQIRPADCYDSRIRLSCCETCERHNTGVAGCEYGDKVTRCERTRQDPGLCYMPENRQFCCVSCNALRNGTNPECPWGDQNRQICEPFDDSGHVRINCYVDAVRRACCETCARLRARMPSDVPSVCAYGDRPVLFRTPEHGDLNCTSIFRHFNPAHCQYNAAVYTNCCYTCHRYQRG